MADIGDDGDNVDASGEGTKMARTCRMEPMTTPTRTMAPRTKAPQAPPRKTATTPKKRCR